MIYNANQHWRYKLLVNGRQMFGAYYVDTKTREVRGLLAKDQYSSPLDFIKTKRGKLRHFKRIFPRGSIRMVYDAE